jgi:hypothetical protein
MILVEPSLRSPCAFVDFVVSSKRKQNINQQNLNKFFYLFYQSCPQWLEQ